MASPASTLKSDRSDGHASQVIELQGGHEVDRLLWRYLQQGTDIMLQHVSGKIRRRLDNMSKSLDYLESNTTMLLQRLRRKGTQQPVDAVEGSDNDTCSVMSSDDTSKPEGGTGRELVVACRGADGALSTRVNVRESDSWSDVRSAIEKSLRTSHNRGIQKIFFQDLTGNLISLDSESSWTLCKSLQSLKEQRHISLVIKDQDKPSALRHPLTASRPDDALSAHVPSGDFLHAQAHGAVVLKDEIRNHSSYDAPTRSNSDPGRARLLKLKPPPLKSKEARSSAVMREHGEHFVSSSTLSLKNMKISNLKEYDVTLPERGSCFKNIMYRSKLEEDASYDIALLEQLGSEGPVHVDLKPSHAVLQAGASCKIALRFTRNAGAANDAAKTNLPNILVGVKAQHSDYFDVLKLRFTAP